MSTVSFLLLFLAFSATAFGQDASPSDSEAPKDGVTEQAASLQTDQKAEDILQPAETKAPPRLGKKFVKNLLRDQKDLWTSPFRIKRDDAKWWLLFTGGTAALIATDQKTSRKLSANQATLSRRLSQFGASYTTLPAAVGLYVFGAAKDNAKAREAGVLGLEAMLNSSVVSFALKAATLRERPDEADGKGHFFKGGRAFPSGHAMMSWSFAYVIAHEYPKRKIVPIAVYGLSAIISASRVSARKHFASDIVAGGTIGWFVGRHVFKRHSDPSIHTTNRAAAFIPQILPYYDRGTSNRGVTLTWPIRSSDSN